MQEWEISPKDLERQSRDAPTAFENGTGPNLQFIIISESQQLHTPDVPEKPEDEWEHNFTKGGLLICGKAEVVNEDCPLWLLLRREDDIFGGIVFTYGRCTKAPFVTYIVYRISWAWKGAVTLCLTKPIEKGEWVCVCVGGLINCRSKISQSLISMICFTIKFILASS